MKWEQGNENAETNQQQKIDVALLRSGNGMHSDRFLQRANIEAPFRRRKTLVKKNESDQQNETAEREINRDLPRGADAIAGSPNSDQQKCRDQRELMKRVKEK